MAAEVRREMLLVSGKSSLERGRISICPSTTLRLVMVSVGRVIEPRLPIENLSIGALLNHVPRHLMRILSPKLSSSVCKVVSTSERILEFGVQGDGVYG